MAQAIWLKEKCTACLKACLKGLKDVKNIVNLIGFWFYKNIYNNAMKDKEWMMIELKHKSHLRLSNDPITTKTKKYKEDSWLMTIAKAFLIKEKDILN